MIAGIYNKEGLMVTPEPGITLNYVDEVLASDEVIESVLPRLSPERHTHLQGIFAPLGEAACQIREFARIEGIKDEEELAGIISEISPSEKVDIHPVIGIGFKEAKLLEAMFKKFGDSKGSATLSSEDASLAAREIDTMLRISLGARISFN